MKNVQVLNGMDWENKDIIETLHKIVKDSYKLSITDLDTTYEMFKTTFPKLYKIIIESVETGTVRESLNRLVMMLTAREDQKSGAKTKTESDTNVGHILAKEYIYPLTETPSDSDHKRAVDKIREGVAIKELKKITKTQE